MGVALQKALGGNVLDPIFARRSKQRHVMRLRNSAARTAVSARTLPIRNAGTMHAGQPRNRRHAAELFDDGRCRFHISDCSDISYTVKPDCSGLRSRHAPRGPLQFGMSSEWTQKALEFAGISQSEAARRLSADFGISVDRAAVNKIVKGKRELAAAEMLALSKITGFPVPEDDDARARTVQIVGLVSAGSDMVSFADGQGPFGEIEAPANATPSTVAVEIRGDSLGPTFNGWILFYNDRREPVSSDLLGKFCVVGLADGRVVAKNITAGQLPGHYNLIANVGPPIYDAEVEWAARVINMAPAGS